MKGCVLLTAFLLSLGATRSARTTCGNDCIAEVCGSYGLSPRCLTIESPQPSLSTCNCSDYLVHCGGDLSGTSSLLTQQFGSSLCGTGSLNQSLSTGDNTSFISNGFYIFRNPRFCENGCFKSFSFHTDGFNNSQEGSRELLKIHIFTRYEVEEVRRLGQFTGDVFLEHTSFNVPLFLQVGSSDVVEADVTDENFCFKREDYFGLSISGNLRIRTVGPGLTDLDGVWRNNNFPIVDETCNTNRSIIELSYSLPEASGNRPVMTIILKDSPAQTSTQLYLRSSSPSPHFISSTSISSSISKATTTLLSVSVSETSPSTGTSAAPPSTAIINVIGVTGAFVFGVFLSCFVMMAVFLACRKKKRIAGNVAVYEYEDVLDISAEKSVKTTNHVEMKANESCSTVIRSNGSSSGDGVVTEVNEAYTSTKNEALYEECDNFQHDSSTFISNTENVAYGQQGSAVQSEELQSTEENEEVDYFYAIST